ncbi:DUF4846 domain-containing protein [Hominifimenecus sp. rT4P-3]|uniref:DUF4846 domain-containing protein n=1 Tax=Hominifimenecus sp. rT4P-3 TaxID=3242979 RepID=UPI003DA1E020
MKRIRFAAAKTVRNDTRKNLKIYLLLLSVLLLLSGCKKTAIDASENAPSAESTAAEESRTIPAPQDSLPAVSAAPKEEKNASLMIPEGATLQTRILPPEGFSRIPAEPGSFGDFVRNYPLLADGSPVLLYDGTEKSNQSAKAAVFDMDVISSADLQQCADSVMRIYAEYFRQTDQPERIRFHFVDGFLFDYPTYRDGGRIKMKNDKASWKYTAGYDDSDETFENYLYLLFAYSSTLSMDEESQPIEPSEIQIGDLFLKGGSPGHVMMVADVCEDENGHKAFLLAQGYMPAQQFHIVKNPSSEENPWYDAEQITYPFRTPEYTFPEGSLKRPGYLEF